MALSRSRSSEMKQGDDINRSFIGRTPPTAEQIRETGGFQTPSTTPPMDLNGARSGIFLISPTLRKIGNIEVSCRSGKHADKPASPPKRFLPTLVRGGNFSLSQPTHFARCPDGIKASLQDREEVINQEIEAFRRQEDDWATEISGGQEDISRAAELEKQADTAYIAQMRVLWASNWVEDVSARNGCVTPRSQLLNGQDEGFAGGFSGFSTPVNGSREEACNNEAGRDDPFSTTPSQGASCQGPTFDMAPMHPLDPNSLSTEAVPQRDHEISPCAYRIGKQTERSFNAIRRDVCRKASEGGDVEQGFRDGSKGESVAGQLLQTNEKTEDSSRPPNSQHFNALIDAFDLTTNEILEEVWAANNRFFERANTLLYRSMSASQQGFYAELTVYRH